MFPAFLYPPVHPRVGGPAVRRVVLEAAVFRRVVGGRDHYAIGEVILAAAVVNQNRPRDNRSRSYTVILLNDGLAAIRRQHFERCPLRRGRGRMRVLSHVERPADRLASPVFADGLRDRQNMGFIERHFQWLPATPAGPETYELVW